MKFDVI